MAYSGALLQEIANPRGIKIQNPVEQASQALQLRGLAQQNQMQGLQLQEAQRKQQLESKIEEAIAGSIGEDGAIDFNKAAAAIAPYDRQTAVAWQQHAQQQTQQNITNKITARKAQLENVQALEQTPAPEVTAAAPQAQPMPYPGQVGEGPTAGGGSQQVPLPVPQQEISGISELGVPSVKVRPESPQQKAQRMMEAERQKLQAQREANTYTITDPTTGKTITAPKDILDNILTQIGENARKSQRTPVPGVDVPYPTAVENQRVRIAGAQATARANAQGSEAQLTSEGLDAAAMAFAKTGQLPPLGMGAAAAADRRKIINRAAQLVPNLDVASSKADFAANEGSLKALQRNRDAVVSFESTALKNLDLFVDRAKKVVDSGSPWINKPLRTVEQKGLGNEELSAFNAARQVAINEIAKVASNPGLTGQLSDSARHEVEAFIPQDATLKQVLAVAETLKADMKNRRDSLDDQIRAIQQRIKGNSGGSAPSTRPPLSSFEGH